MSPQGLGVKFESSCALVLSRRVLSSLGSLSLCTRYFCVLLTLVYLDILYILALCCAAVLCCNYGTQKYRSTTEALPDFWTFVYGPRVLYMVSRTSYLVHKIENCGTGCPRLCKVCELRPSISIRHSRFSVTLGSRRSYWFV